MKQKLNVRDSIKLNLLEITKFIVSEYKVDAMKRRLTDINPDINVYTNRAFIMPDNIAEVDFSSYSYVVDAVDTVTAKLIIIETALKGNIPVLSCMGTGNKLNPGMLEITDISLTTVCPLARVMRRELKKRNITSLKVCCSKEEPLIKLRTPGSISFVPSSAGLLIAAEVVKDLSNRK